MMETCPATPIRHPFRTRAEAWQAVRGQRDGPDSFRVYECTAGGITHWHWHRIVNLREVKNER